ncbi:MAG: hypothetical protein JW990_18120 [Thermoleophilia bacterium]|nr:hypothetical protein [Thermoleophilia bacterium]
MDVLRTFEQGGRLLRLAVPDREASKLAGRASSRASSRAPGAGRFAIEEVEATLEDGELFLVAQVRGRNIAHVFAEVLLKDGDLERYFGPVLREHVPAARSKETRGVSRPVWDDPVDVSVRLGSCVRLLTDGVETVFCFSVPEGYGTPNHRLTGRYTPAHAAAPLRACLTFGSTGDLVDAVAYRERRGRSLPRAVTLREGDRFAPYAQVLTPLDEGEWEVGTALCDVLVLGDRPLRVESAPLMPGEYLAGVAVQDLDGGFTRRYAPLTVGK